VKENQRFLWMLLVGCGLASTVVAQDTATSSPWRFTPSVSYISIFPGEQIRAQNTSGTSQYRYHGTGFSFLVRSFHDAYPNLSLTFGGSVQSYSIPIEAGRFSPAQSYAANGIGEELKKEKFTVFPFTVGAQWVTPKAASRLIILYAGAEATVNFIDGNIDIGNQTKLGYNVVAGFAVSVFEFGIRYTAFSDLKNLGAQIGFRFNSFTL
jgi:hypothetical protein